MAWGPVRERRANDTTILDGAVTLRGAEVIYDRRSQEGSGVETFPVRQVSDMRIEERRGFNKDLGLVPLLLGALTVAIYAASGAQGILVFGLLYTVATLGLAFGFPMRRLRFRVGPREVDLPVPAGHVADVRAFIEAVDAARSDPTPAAGKDATPVRQPTARAFGT